MAERFSDWLPTLLATQATAETLASGLVIGVDVQAWDADLDAIAGLTPTDNKIMAGNGSAWVLADRFTHGAKAAMLAADTDALFHRTDNAWVGAYTWDATVTIAQHQAIVADERYVPLSAGADGAWVMKSADPRAQFFANSVVPATITRAERIFATDSAGFLGATSGNNGGTGSWVQTGDLGDAGGGGGTRTHYFETNAGIASAATGGGGVSGMGRTTASLTGFGLMGLARQEHAKTVWAGYLEAIRTVTGGNVFGSEIGVMNFFAEPGATRLTPASGPITNMTIGLAVQSGGGNTSATAFNCDAAVTIGQGSTAFWSGIVFRDDGLVNWADNRSRAIMLGRLQMITWTDASNNETLALSGVAVGATKKQRLEFGDVGFSLTNDAGFSTFSFNRGPDSVEVNRPSLTAAGTGTGVTYGVAGVDANIDHILGVKGTGVVRFGTFTASGDVAVTGSIQIRTADGTFRKIAVVA